MKLKLNNERQGKDLFLARERILYEMCENRNNMTVTWTWSASFHRIRYNTARITDSVVK
jgi:hypothetical protein